MVKSFGGNIEMPGQAKVSDIAAIDFAQWAETLFVVRAAVCHPVRRIGIRGQQACLCDTACLRGRVSRTAIAAALTAA